MGTPSEDASCPEKVENVQIFSFTGFLSFFAFVFNIYATEVLSFCFCFDLESLGEQPYSLAVYH